MEVETAVNTDSILKAPMISLEKITRNNIKIIQNEYKRLSFEIDKLDPTKPTEKFLYSSLVRKMVSLNEKIKPLTQRLKYLKVGNGVQEDNF